MMSKRKTWDKNLILLLTTTLVTLAVWVGFEVYRVYTKVDIPAGVERHLAPLNPQLDVSVLDSISIHQP